VSSVTIVAAKCEIRNFPGWRKIVIATQKRRRWIGELLSLSHRLDDVLAILNIDLARVGAGDPEPEAFSMLDVHNPALNWVKLAFGMGVEASRATSVEKFATQFASAMTHRGPLLIEVVV
jgi:hypothetical protein